MLPDDAGEASVEKRACAPTSALRSEPPARHCLWPPTFAQGGLPERAGCAATWLSTDFRGIPCRKHLLDVFIVVAVVGIFQWMRSVTTFAAQRAGGGAGIGRTEGENK